MQPGKIENIGSDLGQIEASNLTMLKRLFGHEFINRSMSGMLSTKEVVYANDTLATQVYGKVLSRLIKEQNYKEVLEYTDKAYERVAQPESSLDEIDLDKIGLVLIRPELLSKAQECKDLLIQSNLSIIYEKRLRINLDQYVSLYPHGIAIPESYFDFPTRTLNYVDQISELVVVLNTKNDKSNLPTGAILSEMLKGMQGTYTKNTLRGDIALRAIGTYVNSGGSLIKESCIALDPISAYRKLVSGDIESNEIHNSVDVPILFYAGQGVHVPNRSEVSRDLRVLCDESDIINITKKYLDSKI